MSLHHSSETLGISESELGFLNNELFKATSCAIFDSYYTGGGSIYFELFSECGVGALKIPGERIPSVDEIVAAVSNSDEYREVLRNVEIGSFDKKSLQYVLNVFALGADEDSYMINQIKTVDTPRGIEILVVMMTLYEYGDYFLDQLPETIKRASDYSIYEVVSSILNRTVDGLDMGSWRQPNEIEVSSLLESRPIVASAKELIDYGKMLGLIR